MVLPMVVLQKTEGRNQQFASVVERSDTSKETVLRKWLTNHQLRIKEKIQSRRHATTAERKDTWHDSVTLRQDHTMQKAGVCCKGLVEGRAVSDIILDTGCTKSIVRSDLVSIEAVTRANQAVTIPWAHGDTVLYPLATIPVEVDLVPVLQSLILFLFLFSRATECPQRDF